ncbi:MAG: dihydroneopterin triphosphate diphosphatase [Rhodocyclaceae bacterium]|nr:MAG: dihydroneopterin triphosphate diphosphatase [Rhodocyclaceae bacterium]
MPGNKRPVSVLVLVHTPDLEILLLERAARPGYWQSVTGSQEDGEPLHETARREVLEETGIAVATGDLVDWRLSNRFEIFPEWRHRYPAGVSHNLEHVYGLCVPRDTTVVTAPDEHLDHLWLPWHKAADKVFSWTNRDAILMLPLLDQDDPDFSA